jgi:hypothetical protein
MTAHFPGLVTIPLTHTHDCSLSWLGNDTPNTYTRLLTFHVYVLGVSLPSQESEQSCIYVLGVSLPSQESEQSCVCVRGIVTKPGE